MHQNRSILISCLSVILAHPGIGVADDTNLLSAEAAPAEGGDAAAEMARKLQNPLANIKAVMTDNAIAFNTGTDNGTSYGLLYH